MPLHAADTAAMLRLFMFISLIAADYEDAAIIGAVAAIFAYARPLFRHC